MDIISNQEPSEPIAQENIQIAIKQEDPTVIQQQKLAQQINKRYEKIMRYFNQLLKDFNNNQKMYGYLDEIKVTSQQFLLSFKKIIQAHEQLHKRAFHSKTIKHETNKYYQFLIDILKNKNLKGLDQKGRLVWYLQLQIKLAVSDIFLSQMKQEKTIANSSRQQYKKVWDKITIHAAQNISKTKDQYKFLKKMLYIATSASINQSKHQFSLIKKFAFGCSFPKYFIMNDQAKLDSFAFYRNPSIQAAQILWNLPENGGIRELSKINYQGIKTNVKLYIPIDGVIGQKTDIFTERENTITVRILCDRKLNFQKDSEGSCCSSSSKQLPVHNTIILHMHGGGFIALSSRSMQVYTRKWANQLHVPILSIDYRMPPSHPFPQPLQDCVMVYKFVIEHIHKFMNIRPNNIYLAGDSAGGNLACSLAGMILKNKYPGLKGIYAVYPAVDIRFNYSYSKLYSFTDPLLWPANLILCLKSYLAGDFQKGKHPLASPILLDEEYVNGKVGDKRFPLNWPKTIITVGNRDPLYDSSLMFMEKLVESNIDCECIIYEQLSHGYLNIAKVVTQCERALNDSINHLKRLMQCREHHKS